MQNAKCKVQSAKYITLLLILTLSLYGCGSGGGGTSQVIEGPPSTPTGVNVVVSGSSELAISWNSVENTTYYNIYWSTTPGVSKKSTKKAGITSTNYVHTGLTNGAIYYYVVTAVNSYGESSESAEVSATTLDVPRPPGAVAAVAGDRQVTVSWNTVVNATSYNIYWSTTPGVSGTKIPDITSTSYTHTGLTNGDTYYYVVTAVNSFGEGSESKELAVTPSATVGILTITGSVRYEDKEYGTDGFTGITSYKAVRFAEVQAVEDVVNGPTIATGTTDASGLYTMTIPSASTIYIRVISSSPPLSPPLIKGGTGGVDVKDLSNAFHAVAGPSFTVSGAAMANISIPATNQAAGAFNILDVFTSGAQFVQSLSGGYSTALTTFWQTGNANGTWYCSGSPDTYCPYGEGIYILNYNGDTDEYDDDVLWHEYGHFIAKKYSKDDSPGGAHYLTSNDLDLRLSWSEGWGDFFPGALKAWLAATSPSLLSTEPTMSASVYVDTSGTSGWSFDFGNPNPGASPFPFVYSSNEAAVARVLHRLRLNYGMQAVWEVFTSYIKVVTTPVNLEAFWDGWYTLGKADITSILTERSIDYFADTYEAMSDNTVNISRKATMGQAENHTLYGNGDIDYVAFDAIAGQNYTARTTTLKNGADTYIRIIAPDQLTQVANTNNDNWNLADYSLYPYVPNNCVVNGECHENGSDILGSIASFTASSTGVYYVEVKSSPNRPLSAGRYGGYSLTITSP